MNVVSFFTKAVSYAGYSSVSKSSLFWFFSKLKHLYSAIYEDRDIDNNQTILNNTQVVGQYQLKSQKVRNDYYKYNHIDRMNARYRDMRVRHIKTCNARSDRMLYTAYFLLFITCICVIFCSTLINKDGAEMLSNVSKVLMSCIKSVYIFEFGQETSMEFLSL